MGWRGESSEERADGQAESMSMVGLQSDVGAGIKVSDGLTPD